MDTITAVAGNNLTTECFDIKIFSFCVQIYPRHVVDFFYSKLSWFIYAIQQWLGEFTFERFCKLGLINELDSNLQYVFKDLNISTLTYSKSSRETLKKYVISVQSQQQEHQNNVSDAFLVSLLVIQNVFYLTLRMNVFDINLKITENILDFDIYDKTLLGI